MPQFNYHAPKTQSDMKAMRNAVKLNQHNPIGVISECDVWSYGFNGDYYYVGVGVLDHLVSRMQLTFLEAKAAFDAFCFMNAEDIESNIFNKTIKDCRRVKSDYSDLFWSFVSACGK